MFASKFLSLVPISISEQQSSWIKKQLKKIYEQERPKYYEGEQTTEADFQTSLKQMVALLGFIVQAKPQYTLFSEYKKRVVKLPESPSLPDRLATLAMAKKNLEESLWVVCHTPKDPVVINDYTVDKCYSGAASNIAMALNHFHVLGFESALIASKEKMLRNLILSFINEHQISPAPGNEIHYVNAFINLIAPTYGLQGVVDSFAPQSIPHKTIEQFYTYLETKLTITSLLSTLHTELPVPLPKEPFDASNLSLFKLLEDYAGFITDDIRVHGQITKYLYEFSEDEGIMRPVQHFGSYLDAIIVSFLERLGYVENQHLLLGDNKFIFNGTSFFKTKDYELILPNAEEQQQIQGKLRLCLLGADKLPDSLAISDDALIDLLDEATLWALFTSNETTDNLKNRSIVRLLQANSSLIPRELLRAWLQHTAPNKNGFLFLLNSRYYNIIQPLAEQNLITTENLTTTPLQSPNQGKNALWLLITKRQNDVLHLLIEQNLISTELLATSPLHGPDKGKNALWLLVAQKQYDVLRLLIEQNLISTELLAASPLQSHDQGKNALWMLTTQKQYDVLRLLIEQHLVSTKLLATSPLQGDNQGVNVLRVLIAQKQFDVLRLLIEQNLISTELLAATPLHGPNQGINALWILVEQKQFDVLRRLIEQNLICTELLTASPLQGPNQGLNALWILIDQNQINVLRRLIEQNLISTELLAACPLQGPNQGVNALWRLIEKNQFDVLRLLIEQNLITTELLKATCPQEPNRRKNTLRILIEDHQQYALISQLLKRDLIIMEQISIILWNMAQAQEWKKIERMVQANIITQESLRYTPPVINFKKMKSVPLLWMLAFEKANPQENKSLWECMIKKNLVTREDLSVSSNKGQSKGKNIVWLLANHGRWDTLLLLLNNKLITQEQLEKKPEIKGFIGNALYYLGLALKSNQATEKKSAEQFQQACQKTLVNNNFRGIFFNKYEPERKKMFKKEEENSPQDNHQGSNAMNHSPN